VQQVLQDPSAFFSMTAKDLQLRRAFEELGDSVVTITIGSKKRKVDMKLWKKYFNIIAILKLRGVAINNNDPDQWQFTYSPVTDGNTIGFQYARKAPAPAPADQDPQPRPLDQLTRGIHDESMVSFDKWVLKGIRIIAVDPGSRTPLTLVELGSQSEMRVTSQGYRDQAGVNWLRERQEELEWYYGIPEVNEIISNAPSRNSLNDDELRLTAAAFGRVWTKLWR
jgi:hypothetical protein